MWREVNGTKLHVIERGTGSPVALLHGLLVGNLATWYLTAAPTLSQQHRLLMYDLRGHGRSDRPPSGYDPETMTDDLAALLERFSPDEPVALVGHSFGALVALKFAQRRPDRVSRLALVEAPLDRGDAAALTEFLDRDEDEMVSALPDTLRADLDHGGRRARRLLETLVGLATETTLLDDIAALEGVDNASLAAIRCPVLGVYGATSSCRPSGERLRENVRDLRLVELAGGHYLPLEAPEALTRQLEEFLRG